MKAACKRQRRAGATVVLALAMITVTGLLIGAMLQRSLWEQRQMRIAWNQWQARWLARSALERTKAQMARDVDYEGEVWSPKFENADPRVETQIERNDAGFEITVAADFPSLASPFRVQSVLRRSNGTLNSP